ncbi:unnamed protein product [Bemisia tabaci]|uniref:Uncharacterized protein n=1 Tax=Bemisia tabaci TaxID=7038 RepID=A0A9P0F2Q3_BEMTA|nr:unnamed protein product [Bemisia tabaci]
MKYFLQDILCVYSTVTLCLLYQISAIAHGYSPRDNKEDRGIMAPRMDYEEWTPIGRGDPLKNDPTYDYVPPVLDKVHYWINPASRTSESPLASESQIVALGAPATKKPTPTMKPLKPSEIKRYHTESKPHYQGYGPYISGSKHPNRGRPQYIPLATYSTYKYPRPPLTMLVPPPPSQPVTYPPTTEEELNQITTDFQDKSTDKPQQSTTINGPTSWKTSYSPESTQAHTIAFLDTSTINNDPTKNKPVSTSIDVDTTLGQTTSSFSPAATQTWSSTRQTTVEQTFVTNPLTTEEQTSRQPSSVSTTELSSSQTTSRQPSSQSSGHTTVYRQPSSASTNVFTTGQTTLKQPLTMSTMGYSTGQTSSMPGPQTTKLSSSSLFDLLLKRDSPPLTTSPATFPLPQTQAVSMPFLPPFRTQEAPKAPAYLIIQGHSKVKKYGATKLDKISGIPLQDSNEITSQQDSDANDILRRKTRDVSLEDYLPIDGSYFKSTFEDYYSDLGEEASGLNAIPTR